jgi:hypothetical protein
VSHQGVTKQVISNSSPNYSCNLSNIWTMPFRVFVHSPPTFVHSTSPFKKMQTARFVAAPRFVISIKYSTRKLGENRILERRFALICVHFPAKMRDLKRRLRAEATGKFGEYLENQQSDAQRDEIRSLPRGSPQWDRRGSLRCGGLPSRQR